MKHELKTAPPFFQAVWIGDKPFEIRRNDRNFKERDEVVLQEWDEESGGYTGREIEGFIRYLTTFGQTVGMCVFTLEITHRTE